MIVVDASLAAKWFLVEPDTKQALDFLAARGPEAMAPNLIIVEVTSALVRQANSDKSRRVVAEAQVARWLADVERGIVEIFTISPVLLSAASRVALDLGHPLKDCIYLALAIEQGCDLATCDAKFAAKAIAVWPRVRLLESYA